MQNNIIDIQEHTYNKESESYFNTKFIDTFERMDRLPDPLIKEMNYYLEHKQIF
ncbi:hypothetical protein [uncultured Methanobrevibacter sp.]|uniref:hypothetical protein n=1 Tax=uncultured Methanobrevibacter sp. TaxID=253161 RepID=UPI0025ED6570|nr:hypothetical protein [uncultured Methanobrevibacter sp.]